MAITFSRLQEYLDAIVEKSGGDVTFAPHGRFWSSYEALTQHPLSSPKCHGAPIFAVKYVDANHTAVDADGSPLYLILTDAAGFCGQNQMPSGGPFIADAGYSLTLPDGTVVPGPQIASDIHDWLDSGAPNT